MFDVLRISIVSKDDLSDVFAALASSTSINGMFDVFRIYWMEVLRAQACMQLAEVYSSIISRVSGSESGDDISFNVSCFVLRRRARARRAIEEYATATPYIKY